MIEKATELHATLFMALQIRVTQYLKFFTFQQYFCRTDLFPNKIATKYDTLVSNVNYL